MREKIIELVYRKHGRIVGREACRARNEHRVSLTGRVSREAELRKAGYTVTRRILNDWPSYARL
jgi:hypothetical protein